MGITIAQAAAGVLLLFTGGSALVHGAVSLARRLGVSKLVIGLTIVAFGTSAPELIVSLDAALSGLSGISLGNVVGSNIGNIGLILGLSALASPLAAPRSVTRVDAVLMVSATALLVAMIWDRDLTRLDAAVLLSGLVLYGAITFKRRRTTPEEADPEADLAVGRGRASARRSLVALLLGLVALYFGGDLLVGAAVDLAAGFGLTEATIGLTVVAVGTSLPELATSVVAARSGETDLAVGNVVGSNIFNILGILGISALVRPIGVGAVSPADLAVMLGLAVLLIPALHTGSRISRREGALLLTSYVVYVGWLLVR